MTLSSDAVGPCNPSQSFFITQEMERLILSRIAPTPSPASVFIRPHLSASHHEKVLRLRNTRLNTFIYISYYSVCVPMENFYSVFLLVCLARAHLFFYLVQPSNFMKRL